MWEEASAFVVPAYAPHQIASDHPIIGVLMLEPETIDRSQLPQFLRPDTWDMKRFPDAIHRIREGFSSFSSRQTDKTIDSIDIDFWFFGQRLPEPPTDMRIGPIIHLLRTEPGSLASAEEGARLCNLSMSRFLHRFKAYTGATFRGFRAWKRARSFLRYVNGNAALTDIALEIGYADSSHFSNSIRQMYGLTPRDIFKGSRQLHIYIQSTTGDASSRWPCEIQPAAAAIGADCPTAIGSVTETTRIHVSATDCHLSA